MFQGKFIVKRVVIRKRLLLRLSTALIFGLACLSQAHAGLTFNVVTDWKAGAVAEVVIDNTTNESIKDWTLTFSLDESVTQVWNGTLVSKQGSDVVIAARPYNRVIAPGDSVSVGMIIQPGNIVNGPTDMRINSRTLSGPDSTDTPKTPTRPDSPSGPVTPTKPETPAKPEPPARPEPPAPKPPAPKPPAPKPQPPAPAPEAPTPDPEEPMTPTTDDTDRPLSVSKNGKLGILGNDLVNQQGTPIQLTGMSSHGLQWFGEFMNSSSIEWLRDDWNANVVRAAMYTDPGSNGYIANPSLINKVYEVVDAAVALDMYVIVDWHILSDNDPNIYRAEAIDFFDKVSKRYSGVPNVIYEIANEPNPAGRGGEVNWQDDIKPYAQAVVPAIRANDPDSVIIVGTGTWSQDVQDAANDPLSFGNIAYAMHFYACTHGQSLRDKVSYALSQGVAIFSTEWGTADASGGGSVCADETQTWIDFLNSENISWVNWSLADKNEATAALNPGAKTTGNWGSSELSTSGTLVRQLLRER